MDPTLLPALLPAVAAIAAVLAALLAAAAFLGGPRRADLQTLRLLLEQLAAGQRAESETTRRQLAEMERALAASFGDLRTAHARGLGEIAAALAESQGRAATLMETKLREISERSATQLAAIQQSVNEQLHAAVEKQVQGSFQRVIDQFTAVQKAMVDVQAVTAQIGDLRRIFANVKTRGGWGETQLQALLDDVLPPGSYRTNVKLRADTDEAVEFAITMPMRGEDRPLLAIDAKFPLEDYQRLLVAAEAGDAEGEKAARRGLEIRLRLEARSIAAKYINPPVTVEFAVLYLPTDGLFAEVARIPGLIDEIGSAYRVIVLGPSLAPALLRTIQLGFVTLALEQKAGEVRQLLGATRSEMQRMDEVLDRLGKQAGTFSTTIDRARVRTRAVGRKLREVEILAPSEADRLLELELPPPDGEV
jgi:DNA recombination protein RmuC